jgi:hypothetical protein
MWLPWLCLGAVLVIALVVSIVIGRRRVAAVDAIAVEWLRYPSPETIAETIERCDAPHLSPFLFEQATSSETLRLLEPEPLVALDREQAARFTRSDVASLPPGMPFLVRAVYVNPLTGGYRIKLLEGDLHVHHGSLGSSNRPKRRVALVVFLPERPANVYVTCSTAK